MDNTGKVDSFFTIAKEFNAKLSSVPVLYGSVGLSHALKVELETDDIDMLIEEAVFNSKLGEVRSLMVSLGFVLVDPEENKFHRGSLDVGIASDHDLLTFSGVDPTKLEIIDGQAKYRVLTPNQYLATYRASNLDGYRKNTHKKDDNAKIKLLESLLSV